MKFLASGFSGGSQTCRSQANGRGWRERGRAHGAEDEERVLPHLRLRQRRAHIRQTRVQHVQHVRIYNVPTPGTRQSMSSIGGQHCDGRVAQICMVLAEPRPGDQLG